MITRKITLSFLIVLFACVFQACNGSHSKSGMDTQSGLPSTGNNAGGSDTSHTTNNTRKEAAGVNPKQETKPANGTTTAQGMTGGDSVYQKSTQKSQ